jgi:tetratricopeptide (TPR) repeat protein
MTAGNPQGGNGQQRQVVQGLQLQGGAAVVAPASAFQHGLPPNAVVVIPIAKPNDELKAQLEKGPHVVTPDQMWELLGFNGPAVQVQDEQGRPIAIGLNDLLAGLEKHWKEKPDDLTRARVFAQELLKHQKLDRAEQVLSKLVAKGGTGDDWLALGISQLQQEKFDKAEGTLKGAMNLLKQSPYPPLHLARLFAKKKDDAAEDEHIAKAIETDAGCVDAWAYMFQRLRERGSTDEDAVAALEKRAEGKKNPAPYIAIQGFFAGNEKTRPKAIEFAKKAVEVNSDDPICLLCLSALHGQAGDLKSVVELLSKHENKMALNVHLANNYFEALFGLKQIDKVTKLLNVLATSQNREVKQFAIQRSQLVAQYLQQQQQALAGVGKA